MPRREIGEWGPFSRRVYGLFGCVWAVCGMEALVTMFSSHYPGRWGCDGKGLAPPTLARLSSLGVHCADGCAACVLCVCVSLRVHRRFIAVCFSGCVYRL